ncbi:MAG: CHASE domain-containing protein [Anaeromyxobacter sp.]
MAAICATFVMVWALDDAAHVRSSSAFERATRDVVEALEDRIQDEHELLRGGVGLFAASADVTRQEWARYVRSLHLADYYPGMIGMGYGVWVPQGALAAHEAAVRREGFTDYAVWPPGAREGYAPVFYVEPFVGQPRAAFGFDMLSEPVRREALERARDTGTGALSARVVLIQEQNPVERPGVLLYEPVYRNGAAIGSVAQRREALLGWVYAPIRIHDFVHSALRARPPGIAFAIHAADRDGQQDLLYDSQADGPSALLDARPDHESVERLEMLGQTWTVHFRSLPGFGAAVGRGAGQAVLAVGLLGSLILFGLTLRLARSRARAVALVDALREGEERYRSAFHNSPGGALLVDPESQRFLAFNDQACRQLGYSREEFAGLTLNDVDAAETPAETREHVRAALDAGHAEFRVVQRHRSGELRNVEVIAHRVHLASRPVFLCFWRDVTDQLRAERTRRREAQALAVRVRLMNAALTCSLKELLTQTLDELEELTGSRIGFYHFVDEETGALSMQAWSTRTTRDLCRAQPGTAHYPITEAGVWAEAVRLRRPVIHQDLASVAGRKGMPPDHAEVVRELVVPVVRDGRVVAALGVGNKAAPYGEDDVAVVSSLADLTWEVVERRRVLDRLRDSDARLAAAFDRAPMMMMLARLDDGCLLSVNQRFLEVSGLAQGEALGSSLADLGLLSEAELGQMFQDIAGGRNLGGRELGVRARRGRLVVRAWGELIEVAGERCVLVIAQDVTQEHQLRTQLTQAQKLESVGRLAGGVAHDFNNMLSVILGNAEALLSEGAVQGPLREDLEAIQDAATRASVVTRQLLAFARKQAIEPRVLDLNDVVPGVLKMLRRLIGEDIDLQWRPGFELRRVRIDPSQVDQLLANLCVNSRDAIHGVGRVTIENRQRGAGRGRLRAAGRPGAGHLRQARRPRRRQRHPGRGPAPCLRALLHHQAERAGDGAGAGHRLRHRHPERRRGRGGELSGGRQRLLALLPGGGGAGQRRPAGARGALRRERGDHPAGGGRAGRAPGDLHAAAEPWLHGGHRRHPGGRAGRGPAGGGAAPPAGDRRGHARHERPRPGRPAHGRAPRAALPVHVRLHRRHRQPPWRERRERPLPAEAVHRRGAGGEGARGAGAGVARAVGLTDTSHGGRCLMETISTPS